ARPTAASRRRRSSPQGVGARRWRRSPGAKLLAVIIPVHLGARSYDIVVERGALASMGARLRALGVGSRTALFTDPGIARRYGRIVSESLTGAGFIVSVMELPEGEAAKTLAVAADGWDACVAAGLDR